MTKTTTYTGVKRLSLAQAHFCLLQRTDMSEGNWLDAMFEFGCRFAEEFANLLPNSCEVKALLLKAPAQPGQPNNAFWMWWRVKWMLDDEGIVANRCLDQPITYPHLKSYMIGDETLETELLNMIDGLQ